MDENLKNEKTYDRVFWTTIEKLKRFIIPLINEAFDDNIPEDAEIKLKPTKIVVRQPDGSLKETEVDSMIEVIGKDGSQLGLYHFECQDWGGKGVAIKIAEYGVGKAYSSIRETENGVVVTLPNSAVILLRGNTVSSDEYTITLEYPNGSASYNVPIVKVDEYDLDAILSKNLWLLLPYYGFRFVGLFEAIEKRKGDITEEERKEINNSVIRVNELLEGSIRDGRLSIDEGAEIAELFDRVLQKLTIKIDKKGELGIMKTEIIRTKTDELLERGMKKGMVQ